MDSNGRLLIRGSDKAGSDTAVKLAQLLQTSFGKQCNIDGARMGKSTLVWQVSHRCGRKEFDNEG